MYYEFILNTNCNWNCYYCVFPIIRREKIIIIDLIKKYNWLFDEINKIIKKDDVILLQGGEIGLINNVEIYKEIFSKFKYKVSVNTNGKFLEKNYHEHPKLKPYIKEIYYHLVEDPKNLVKIKKYESDIPIINGIVGEPKYLYDFIKYNDHIFFHYVDVETKNVNFKYEEHLKDFQKLLELPNVNKEKVQELIDRCYQNIDIKDVQQKCFNNNPFISINLAEEKIVLCTTKGNHIGIPLTKDNLIKMLISNPIKEKNEFCKTCVRTCVFNAYLNKKQIFINNKFWKILK